MALGDRNCAVMHLDCNICLVRDWTPADRDSLIRFANKRNIWRNMTHRFPHPYTESDAESWFASLREMTEPTHWAIEVDNRAIGGIGVDLGEGVYAKSGHFGYWLGEPYWGRGIMTAAVRATSAYAMSRFGLTRLESPVFEWNPRSMRVLEKCGFVREGVQRQRAYKDGAVIDTVLYALVV
jgi:ribosomal-protein-alanine N-acetyltransferase